MRKVFAFVLIAVVFAVFCVSIYAQKEKEERKEEVLLLKYDGVIVNESDQPLANVKVMLRNGMKKYTEFTNNKGVFKFTNLGPGTDYDIIISDPKKVYGAQPDLKFCNKFRMKVK